MPRKETHEDYLNMKKNTLPIVRKHGLKARRASAARFRFLTESDAREAGPAAERLKTKLTYEINSQAYLWITDRGRSRLIKH